jgi:tetratricopeptide (TPR) repeat protein
VSRHAARRHGRWRTTANLFGLGGLVSVLGTLLREVLQEALGNVAAIWLGYGSVVVIPVLAYAVKSAVEARRRVAPGDRLEGAGPASSPLPPTATALGRGDLIGRVVRLATERGNVVVHGPAGIGTSTVAIQAGRQLVPNPDRQTYVDLRGQNPRRVESARRVCIRVLVALGLPTSLARDLASAARQVEQKLRVEDRLLLLDNVAGADQVGWLGDPVPGAYVLVAGDLRAADLHGFADAAVGPLDPAAAFEVLNRAHGGSGGEISDQLARLDPGQWALASWYLGNPSIAIAMGSWLGASSRVSLSGLIDHMVSGGEDAASAIRFFVGERIREGLDRDAARLAALLVHAPVSALSEAALARYAGWRPDRLGAALDVLVRRGLVERTRPARYRIPEAVRSLDQPRPAAHQRATGRLVAHYAARAAIHARTLAGAASPEQRAEAVGWFRLEDGALLELLQPDHPPGGPAGGANLWQLADALDIWFGWDDRLEDRWAAAHAMAQAAHARGDRAAEETALLRLAVVDELLGRDPSDHLVAARAVAGRSRDAARQSRLEEREGALLLAAGDLVAAANEFRSARRRRPRRDVVGQVIDLTNLGAALLGLNDLNEAADCAGEALVMAERSGDVAGQAYAHEVLGLIAARRQTRRPAVAELEEARRLHASVGDSLAEARCLTDLAAVWLTGPDRPGTDREAAREALRLSLELRAGHGPRLGIALTHLLLAEAGTAPGEPAESTSGASTGRLAEAGLAALGPASPHEPEQVAAVRARLTALEGCPVDLHQRP